MKLWVAALTALLATACAHGDASPKPEITSEPDLVLIATTDFHSETDMAEKYAQAIRDAKAAAGDRALLLDGGDIFQGSIEGGSTRGKVLVDLYNTIGFDAVAVGNHDFDYGTLMERKREAKFKWLSANILNKDGTPVFATHAVFDRGGAKACVIGATTPGTKQIVNPAYLRGYQFAELEPVIRAEAAALRKQGCDFVILVSHAGLLCNKSGSCQEKGAYAEILELLHALPEGTLDAVVAGHTHQFAQEVIRGTPVIEAGSSARGIGILELRRSGKPGKFKLRPFTMLDKDFKGKSDVSDVTSLLAESRAAAVTMKNAPLGSAKEAFPRDYLNENALANMMVEALLDTSKKFAPTQFAIMNAGGFRADLPKGPLIYNDLYRVVPFDNHLAIVDLKGSELRRAIEVADSGAKGMSPIAGLKIKRLDVPQAQAGPWDRDLNGDGKKEVWERNLIVEVWDTTTSPHLPLQEDKLYKVATIDYLVMGGDGQSGMYSQVPKERIRLYPEASIRDLFAEYIRKHPNLDPKNYFNSERRVELVSP